MANENGNKEYRSDVFSMLLQDKRRALEVYNAMNETAYDDPELELVCKVYNINKGNNERLLARCPTLRDYMYFIDAVREYHAETGFTDLEGAIERAISQCIRENVLREFLVEHRTEVTHVMTMDYTFERRLEFQCEEAIEKGMQKKMYDLIRKKVLKRKSLEQIAEELEEDPDEIRPLYEQMKHQLFS